MVKVGLVGEDPNDTLSIKNLLEKRYKGKVQFHQLAKRIQGYQLDNPKIKKSFPIEFEHQEDSFLIYIRDLDAFKSLKDREQAKTRRIQELTQVT